jgi:hypothetical protein
LRPARTQEVLATAAGIRLIINPQTDGDFGRRVNELAGQARGPEELEVLLRSEYPRTVVARGVIDVVERWYVYREGHWINATGP